MLKAKIASPEVQEGQKVKGPHGTKEPVSDMVAEVTTVFGGQRSYATEGVLKLSVRARQGRGKG